MLEFALLILRAVGLLLVRHVVLQDGVAGLALFLARGGDAGVRAVEHAQVLAPDCNGCLYSHCDISTFFDSDTVIRNTISRPSGP